MKDNLRPLYGVAVGITLVVGLMTGPASQVFAKNANPGIIPPYARPHGMTYGEWGAKFSQWNYSLPSGEHPLFDTADCHVGQTGKVWFLGGTFTVVEDNGVLIGEASRECTIPAGTALFFPILNTDCNEFVDVDPSAPPEDVETYLRGCANDLADYIQVQDLKVTVDGKEIEHLGLYRKESPPYMIGPLPYDNVLGLPEFAGDTALAVGDGYWIMLAPLSRGEHDIHFEGAVFVEEQNFRFELFIDYHVTVVPRSRW
jgi:hypothetical protein